MNSVLEMLVSYFLVFTMMNNYIYYKVYCNFIYKSIKFILNLKYQITVSLFFILYYKILNQFIKYSLSKLILIKNIY